MLFRLILGAMSGSAVLAQTPAAQVEIANLREDVRGLVQRVGDLTLRLEQLERDNAALRSKAGSAERNYATLAQLNEAVVGLNRDFKSAVASAKNDTLQQVGVQLEKLANQTNAALESLSKAQPPRTTTASAFAENYPKEGVSYTVQKGDTLAVIAKKTNARQQDIINANKITDPSRIVVGQTLFIPLSNSAGK